jgi:IrrE N-terminal-like domain
MTITLDRIALEDVGLEPQRLAEAILTQIGYSKGKVPIDDIAYALGIVEIREEPLTNLEGTLITTPERDCGSILLNSNSSPQRRRYTAGHEVGHFLNPNHTGNGAGRSCSKQDLSVRAAPAADTHRRQEGEANRFAIEILAPRIRCKALIGHEPDFAEILAMHREFDISREAAARRYVELNDEPIAVAFSKNGRLSYSVRSRSCPYLSTLKGEALSLPRPPTDPKQPTEMGYVDPANWSERFRGELMVQTLFQQKGFAITLLRFAQEEKDELEIEDTYNRIFRQGR